MGESFVGVRRGGMHELPPEKPLHGERTFTPDRDDDNDSDGTRLLSASNDSTVRLMRLPLGRTQGSGFDLVGHAGPVVGAEWSHDDRLVLTRSADRSVAVWNATETTGKVEPLLEITADGRAGKRTLSLVRSTKKRRGMGVRREKGAAALGGLRSTCAISFSSSEFWLYFVWFLSAHNKQEPSLAVCRGSASRGLWRWRPAARSASTP